MDRKEVQRKEEVKRAAEEAAEKTFENGLNIWKTAKDLCDSFQN